METVDILNRLREINLIRNNFGKNSLEDFYLKRTNYSELSDGISVVITTYKGENYILKNLTSLINQTIPNKLVELIVVINGEKDSTESIIRNLINEKNINNIQIIALEESGVSLARNTGIKAAKRKFLTFVDDDDYVSENYLEEMYRHSNNNQIVVAQIVDFDDNGVFNDNNYINEELKQCSGKLLDAPNKISKVATITACKLIPTWVMKEQQFCLDLKSGDDVAYFTELFMKVPLKLKVISISSQVIYYRYMRKDSLSRQTLSFDFNVKQRLDVISKLDELFIFADTQEKRSFLVDKIRAQFLFLNRYLKENLDEKANIFNEIAKYNLSYLPFDIINKELSRDLVISYCFPPYVDTAGNVMAKRIRSMNKVVDVVYNNMERVREKDLELNKLVDDCIENRFEINSYTSFSNWKAIEEFCNKGYENIKNTSYDSIYSRVMWPASNFLAFQYKVSNPRVKWTVEFSDPILLDIHGKERTVDISNKKVVKLFNEQLNKKYGLKPIKNKNLFFWCEYLAYYFADEIIFTNKNQYQYMTQQIKDEVLLNLIQNKAVISEQPTLPKEFYNLKKTNYKLDDSKVNIAYFGAFYATRSLNEIFEALISLEDNYKQKVKVHIFTSNPGELRDYVKNSNLTDNVVLNSYVNFYEFLNLSTLFDCLIVNDAKTEGIKSINPYLPSKLSDYLGSGTPIWGLYERGSVMSSLQIDYKSAIGDVESAKEILGNIINNSNF